MSDHNETRGTMSNGNQADHAPVDRKGRTVCTCGDFNCASLDAGCGHPNHGNPGHDCGPFRAEASLDLPWISDRRVL